MNLGKLIRKKMRRMTYRDAAKQLRMNHCTVYRAAQGERIEFPNAVKILRWLGYEIRRKNK